MPLTDDEKNRILEEEEERIRVRKKIKGRKWKWILITIAVMIALGTIIQSTERAKYGGHTRLEIYSAACVYVEQALKHPKTADFSLESESKIAWMPNDRKWYVQGNVTSQNSFGVPSEHLFTVVLVDNGGFVCKSLVIDQREYIR